MSDEPLDRLIDDVAKQLTAGQPSSDFRARVIARLDRPPRRAWWTSWIAIPVGAMAVTMIALAVARPFKGRDRGAESSTPRQSSQAVKKETAPAAPTPDTTTVRLPPSSANGFGGTGKPDTTYEGSRQGTRVAAAGHRQDPSSGAAAAVAALAPPPLAVPPLGIEAIGIDALPTDSIAVPQLDAIAPIGIAPLPADDARPSGANEGPIDDSRRPT
jgi:hypothetical protein